MEGILRSFLFLLWAPLCLCDALAAEDTKVPTRTAPSWVIPHSVDFLSDPPKEGVSDGVWVVLSDRQINLAKDTFYHHFARKLLNESAVQNNSRISVSFHPDYETLTWHKLVVYRDGHQTDRLGDHDIRLLNRESSLEDNLYDGSRTAVIEVQDVRPGDIIEYSFSIKGSNPILDGKFSDILTTSYSIPVREMHIRLLEPHGRDIAFRQNFPILTLERSVTDDMSDLRWSGFNIPAVVPDGEEPSWADLYGSLEFSEFKSWADVDQWALKHYELPPVLPPALQAEIDRIKTLDSGEKQIIAALEYVQDRIRYLSVSEGVHNYKPYPIEDVVKRGFGDCKDKARLLSAMLTTLGFDAKPALVNTYFRQAISDWLPSPIVFDHVVVRLNWKDRTYWLDPTASLQRGPLRERFFPNYGRALVIEDGQSRLTSVDPSGFDSTQSSLVEKFDITSYDSNVAFQAETTYSGATADLIRDSIANTTPGDFSKNCVNYYTRYFPGIKETSPPQIDDDSEKNRIKITENYEIENFLQPYPDNDKLLYGEFYAARLANDLSNPSGKLRRTNPLAVRLPRNVDQTIIINLPDDSKFAPESKLVDNPAFSYKWNAKQTGRELRLTHTYRSKRDHVDAGEMEKYLRDLRTSRDLQTYTIQFPKTLLSKSNQAAPSDETTSAPSWSLNFILLGFFVLFALLAAAAAVALYFWNPSWPPSLDADSSYAGFHGWLILVAIGLVLSPMFLIFGIISFAPYFQMEAWANLTTPGRPDFHPLWGFTTLYEVAVVLTRFSMSCLAAVLFFQKRKTFPPLMITFLLLTLGAMFIDAMLVSIIAATAPDTNAAQKVFATVITFIVCAVWVPYYLVSKRVKSTFIR